MSWSERDSHVTWHPFTQMQEWSAAGPLVIERGDGNYLIDVDGNRYLDAIASLWCNVHGHRHPRLDAAVVAQLGKLAHSTFLGLSHPPGIELSEKLIEISPRGLERVFFSDAGSTAVEIALKLAFQYQRLVGHNGRDKFLYLRQGYHGDTLGAVGVGGIEIFHRIFGPLIVPGIAITPAYQGTPDGDEASLATALAELDEVLEQRGSEIAAIIVEPLMQGAAGMLNHVPGYLRELIARCRAQGVLVIVDEVATGFGRTGPMFACEIEDVQPDLMCVAKGITGGYLPLAATLTTARIFEAFLGARADGRHFFHGHTYTANPLACAVAIASIDLLQESSLSNAQSITKVLVDYLAGPVREHPLVKDIRRVGLMIGIELFGADGFAGLVCQRARAKGVILRPLGNVLVWMPPLTLTVEDAELLLRATLESLF